MLTQSMTTETNTQSNPEISVVIPMYNEADNVAPLLNEVRQALAGRIDYEILAVDDHSSDATAAEILRQRQRDPHVRLIQHRYNCGQSAGLRSGILAARGAWIATLDGDGQNDPADIPDLYAAATGADAPDMVCGIRHRRQDSRVKLLSSRIANTIRRRLLDDHVTDTGCGLKLFRRQTYLQLPYFDHMHRFLPALVQMYRGRIASVNVNHRPRRHGQSKYGINNRLWVGIIDLIGVMWLKRRCRLPQSDEVS